MIPQHVGERRLLATRGASSTSRRRRSCRSRCRRRTRRCSRRAPSRTPRPRRARSASARSNFAFGTDDYLATKVREYRRAVGEREAGGAGGDEPLRVHAGDAGARRRPEGVPLRLPRRAVLPRGAAQILLRASRGRSGGSTSPASFLTEDDLEAAMAARNAEGSHARRRSWATRSARGRWCSASSTSAWTS